LDFAIAIPSPVPSDLPKVKKGSKSFGKMSAGMPQPVSVSRRTTSFPSRAIVKVRMPPPFIEEISGLNEGERFLIAAAAEL
jgi:hypothetical protein